MKRIGLALSGGGFRATLYHLGLTRFLRDAGILPSITHITSVSGGSVFAAHLALNWGRYTGSNSEFDAAASELLTFVRMDVRNRIIRRHPLCYLLSWPRRLFGLNKRLMTRPGLLEWHYKNFLLGDTSLFQLPASPQLHILATNLSEGCLCSFNRDGLWMVRRQPGGTIQIDRMHVGLATVPMAVAASSAFPGFFPPLELTGVDVGASSGEFGRQSYTDGGVFDNLGVRMFRCLEAILKQQKCTLDGVLVSDVGRRIEAQGQQYSTGLIRTAMRAADILMDRVWQLENETFKDTPGFVFARSTDIVSAEEDPTALHAELQHQAAKIRTDLDRFSNLEIGALIQHGYCVARKACRANPELFGDKIPADPPWNPMPEVREPAKLASPAAASAANREASTTTVQARSLQKSAGRRIWSTLLDYRDWTSYVYVPIIVPILFLTPYLVYQSYQHSRRMNQLIESISQGSPDYDIMSRLLDGPIPNFNGDTAEEFHKLEELNFTGFEVLQDSRILDLRPWNPNIGGKGDQTSLVYGYRRLKVLKTPNNKDHNVFRIGLLATSPKTQFRFPPQALQPKLHMAQVTNANTGEKSARFEAIVDFQKVPPGDMIDVIYEHYSPGAFLQRGEGWTSISIRTEVDTAEMTRWFLMPRGREYRSFRILKYETGKPHTAEVVKGFTEYLAQDSTILAYKIVSAKAGHTYEVMWYYK